MLIRPRLNPAGRTHVQSVSMPLYVVRAINKFAEEERLLDRGVSGVFIRLIHDALLAREGAEYEMFRQLYEAENMRALNDAAALAEMGGE